MSRNRPESTQWWQSAKQPVGEPALQFRRILSFRFVLRAGNGYKAGLMADHIYKKIELVGSSPQGIEDAVSKALAQASKTVRNLRWFEVSELRGDIHEGKVAHWQVTVKLGFKLENEGK